MKNFYNSIELEAGIDEAGAGTLVGSLFVASFILPKEPPYNEKTSKPE